MKRRGLSLFVFLIVVALAAQASESQPVSPVQLMAWLIAGVPSGRLVRIIQERGVTNLPAKIRSISSKLPAPIRTFSVP